MRPVIVVAGTGTDIGKTVFSAALCGALNASYWKPVQAGREPETDSQTVRRLAALPTERIVPEAYVLATAASPHIAAEREGVTIDPSRLKLPTGRDPLVIELAGGLLVPLSRTVLQIDIIRRWPAPVILCATTALGTINHSLLSIEALRARSLPLSGIAFIGEENIDTERTICSIGGVRRLGRLPTLPELTPETLRDAFREHFQVSDFL